MSIDRHSREPIPEVSRANAIAREARLRLTIQSAGLALFEFDPATRTLTLDSLGKVMLGLPARVVMDGEWSGLLAAVHPDDRIHVRDALERALDPKGEGAYADDFRRPTPEGSGESPRWIEARGRAFFDDGAVPVLLTGTLREITERKEAERERETLIDELARTVRFSEMFVGVLGHDLRNPLAAIVTAAQVAQRKPEGAALAKPLAQIIASSRRMARMIEQLLDFTSARLGTGIPLQLAQADLRALAQQVTTELGATYASCRLDVHATGDTGGTWDADRLAQILSNLCANAVQHGDQAHGVRVDIDGTHPDVVVLRVHNRGSIPAELIASVFEPFRGSGHKRDGSRGLGLGLYVTKQIALAHGGDVEVHSSPDAGTTFVLHLPRHARISSEEVRRDGDDAVEKLARRPTATSVTAQMFGSVPLHERVPAEYWALYQRYANLLDAALQRQAYKGEGVDLAEELRQLAEHLGTLRAGAREVAELHARALRQKTRGAPAARVTALIAEGRLIALELMGHLVSYYRRRSALGTLRRGE